MATNSNPTNSSAVLKLTQHDHLMSKLIGSGNPDTKKHEWAENMARDTLAFAVSAPDMLQYLAIARGVSPERTRSELLAEMMQPCGPPPPPQDYNFLLVDFMPPKKKANMDE